MKPDEVAPRIVVNGIISAGDTIQIKISESRGILYEGATPAVTTANAQLFDIQDNLLGSFTHNGDGNYSLNSFLPVAGAVYKLKVNVPGFNEVNAITYVPEPINILSIDTLRIGDRINYTVNINDNPNEKNFYIISVWQISWNCNTFGSSGSGGRFFCSKQVEIENGQADINGERCDSTFLFSDASFNGTPFGFKLQQSFCEADCTELVVTVRSISEDYFKYRLTDALYDDVRPDPFSTPVQVYSNIENGFGIFGGASTSRDTIYW